MYPSQIGTLSDDNPAVLMKADYSDYIAFRKSFFFVQTYFSRSMIYPFLNRYCFLSAFVFLKGPDGLIITRIHQESYKSFI